MLWHICSYILESSYIDLIKSVVKLIRARHSPVATATTDMLTTNFVKITIVPAPGSFERQILYFLILISLTVIAFQ